MPRSFLALLLLAPHLSAGDRITASIQGVDGFTYTTGQTDDGLFVIKQNGRGETLYSKRIPAPASPQFIAVNAAGEALISGQSVELGEVQFPVTPGAVGDGGANTGFILKLDAAGSKILVGIRGYGMGPVAYDAANNIYVAGAAYGTHEIQPSPGAFQSTHELRVCGGNGFIGIACSYQYVAKISPDGTRLLYSTFLTGAFGARPSGLIIDEAGHALVAGTTNSPDYPVTEGSFQTEYRSANPPPPPASFRPSIYPPPSSGYLSKLNATGTALVWSTYFSGTGAETISRLRRNSDGGLVISGLSASRDLPMAQGLPRACPVGYFPEIPFVAELSGDGKTLAGSHYLYDIDNFEEAANPYLCLVDSADIARLTQAASGQLVTLFGEFPEQPEVSFNGLPARVLYASPGQLNVQVPMDLAEGQPASLTVAGNTRPVEIVKRAPSAFMDLTRPLTPLAMCGGGGFSPAYPAIATNEDGSRNTCEHPASKGSVVTFYLNGLGRTPPPAALEFPDGGRILSLEPDPASSGVWRMRFQLSPNANSGSIAPVIDGVRLRYPFLAIWVER